jgi:hypothetical protein
VSAPTECGPEGADESVTGYLLRRLSSDESNAGTLAASRVRALAHIAACNHESDGAVRLMAKASRDAGADPTARPGAHILPDRVPGLADCLLVNPPLNSSGWGKDESRSDARWQYGAPPAENANFAWLQYVASTMSPRGARGRDDALLGRLDPAPE